MAVACPSCRSQMELPPGAIPGSKIECPDCLSIFRVARPQTAPMQIPCLQCRKLLEIEPDLVGKLVECPHCSTRFQALPAGQLPARPPVAKRVETPSSRTTQDTEAPRRTSRRDADEDEEISSRDRRSQDDEEEDEEDDRPRRKRKRRSNSRSGEPVPTLARMAGGFWIVVGVVGMISTIVNLLFGVFNPPGQQVEESTRVGSLVFGFLFYLGFLATGYQTFTGTSKGILGSGIVSLLMSLCCLGGAAFACFAPRGQGDTSMIAIVVVGILGLALFGAGLSAILGASDYKEWYLAKNGSSRRHR